MGESYYNDIINYVSHMDIRQEDIPFILSTFSDWIEALVKESKPEFTEIKLGDIVFTYDDFTKLVGNGQDGLLSIKLFSKTFHISEDDDTLVFDDTLLFGKGMDNFLPALSKKGIFNIMKYNLIKHSSISDKAEIHYINASDETSYFNKDPLKETIESIKQDSLGDGKVHYILTDLASIDSNDNEHVTLYVVVKDKIFEFDSVGRGIFDKFSTKFLQQSDESSCVNIELKQLDEFLKIQEKLYLENKDNSIDKFYEYFTKFYSENGMESYVNSKDLNGDFIKRTKSGDNITNKRLAIVDYSNLKHEQSVNSLRTIKEALKNRKGFLRDIKDNLEKLLDKKVIKMKYYDDKAKKFIDKDINSDTIKLRIISPIILLEMLNKGLITDIKDNELYNKRDDSGTFTVTINNESINNFVNEGIVKTPANKRDIIYYRKLILEKTEKLDGNELAKLENKLDNIIFEKFLDNNKNKESAEYKFLYNCIINNDIQNIEEYLTNIDKKILKIGLDLVCICGNEDIFDKLVNNEKTKQILLNGDGFLDNCFKDSFKFNKSEKIFKNLFDRGCKNNEELTKVAFEFACKTGDLNMVNDLIDNENINDLDLKKGFYLSCLNGKTETFKKILEKIGENIYKEEYKNILEKGFYKVCEFGYTEIYKEIIEKIKDKKEYEYLVDNGFKYACRYGNLDVFKDLFEVVKNKDEVIVDGFKLVCKNGNSEIFDELFEVIGNNKEKNTYTIYKCFREVCKNDNIEIFKKLFGFFTLTYKDLVEEGFELACENDSIEIFEELFEIAKEDKGLLSKGFKLACSKASMKIYNKFFKEIRNKDEYENILIDNFESICFYENIEVSTEIFDKIKNTNSEKISEAFEIVCRNNKKEMFEKIFEEIKDKEEYKKIIKRGFIIACERGYTKISERIYEDIKNKENYEVLVKEIFELACNNGCTRAYNRIYEDFNRIYKDKEEYEEIITNGFILACNNGYTEIFIKIYEDIDKKEYKQKIIDGFESAYWRGYTEIFNKIYEDIDKKKYKQKIIDGFGLACEKGYTEIFSKIYEDIKDKEEYKQKIIDGFESACENGYTEIFNKIYEDIDKKEYKQKIIDGFESACWCGYTEIFNKIYEDIKDKEEYKEIIISGFESACKKGYTVIFSKIYEDIKDKEEYREIIIDNFKTVCKRGSTYMLEIFLEKIKDREDYPTIVEEGRKVAEENGNKRILEILPLIPKEKQEDNKQLKEDTNTVNNNTNLNDNGLYSDEISEGAKSLERLMADLSSFKNKGKKREKNKNLLVYEKEKELINRYNFYVKNNKELKLKTIKIKKKNKYFNKKNRYMYVKIKELDDVINTLGNLIEENKQKSIPTISD